MQKLIKSSGEQGEVHFGGATVSQLNALGKRGEAQMTGITILRCGLLETK